MTNRTLQFMGIAYGNVPVQLNAHINGELIFSGAVETVDTPLPDTAPDMSGEVPLFTLVDSSLFPVEFSGSYPMTISVATGDGIYIEHVHCNYMWGRDPVGNVVTPGNATTFVQCYNGTPTNSDGTHDSRSSVTIDGVPQNPNRTGLPGQWTWEIIQGSTIACNFNIAVGNVG